MAEGADEVVALLFKPGTRYRAEKFVVIIVYLIVCGLTIVWLVGGTDEPLGLAGRFEVRRLDHLDERSFAVHNTGRLDWNDARIALNGDYLATLDEVKSGSRRLLGPDDFRYYYHVPRPWGAAGWERLGEGSKPGEYAPAHLEVEEVDIRCRRGEVDVEFDGGV